MNEDCTLRKGVELNVEDVSKIAVALKSLSAYSMLAYEHDDDPEELDKLVQEGLSAVERLFIC